MNMRKRLTFESRLPARGPAFHLAKATFLSAFLIALTLSLNGTAATVPSASAQQAVDRGLKFLQKEAFWWKNSRSCAACHHADTMLWTFNEARARGYAVDEQALAEITTWAFGDMKTNALTGQPPPRDVLNLGWVYVLLSMETVPGFRQAGSLDKPHPVTAGPLAGTNAEAIFSARQTLIHEIVTKQVVDGSWGRPLDERVPLGGPVEDIAILSRLALLQSGDSSAAVTECVNKAAGWLAANRDKTSRQGINLRLLMDVCEGKPATERKPAIAAIKAEQNADGGWSQTPEMPSDAYATGQTLYVLARAGIKPKDPALKRGVEFLTLSQREDGSWPMTSRVHAKNLSPITGAGTAWAILGLLRASP
jgi:N-acyl-D-amino-acid deacylase